MSDGFSVFLAELPDFFVRHYFMCGAWLVVLVMLIGVQAKLMMARVQKTTVQSAILKVNNENGVFVDMRENNMFVKGHITNSVNISLKEIKEQKINRIEKNKDTPIILVGKDKLDTDCFNGAVELKKQGFTKVFILEGGILEWLTNNLPLTKKK